MKKLILYLALFILFISCSKEAFRSKTVFRIANGADPQSLDPAKVLGATEHRLMQAIFEGLFSYDPMTGEPVLAIAQDMPDISEDGRTYIFKLRKDVYWSDGTPLSAGDFVYGMKRILNPKVISPYAAALYVIEGAEAYHRGFARSRGVKIEALDDYTLKIVLRAPTAYFLNLLPHYAYMPQPRHIIEKFGDDWTKVGNYVTNGPFIVQERIVNSKIVLTKNPYYYDKDNVKLDKVIFYSTDDDEKAFDMQKRGEIDWNTGIFPSSAIEEVLSREDVQIISKLSVDYYVFNTLQVPFNDEYVRRAFAMVLDRNELVNEVLKDGSIAMDRLVPPMPGYPIVQGTPFDPQKARELLSAAGYPGGEGLPKIELLYNNNDKHRLVAEWAKKQWEKYLGVKVSLQNEEWKTFVSHRARRHFDIARGGWLADYQDPMTFLEMFLVTSPLNDGRYSSREYNKLVTQAQTLPMDTQRFAKLAQAESLLVFSEQGIIPLYALPSINLINTEKWGGWYVNSMDVHPIKNIYLKESSS